MHGVFRNGRQLCSLPVQFALRTVLSTRPTTRGPSRQNSTASKIEATRSLVPRMGSTPITRTFQKSPIMGRKECPYVKEKAVAVMACDDEIVPLQKRMESASDDADLEEVYDTERHLLYVACTRARENLLVTSVQPASEFLDDLKG